MKLKYTLERLKQLAESNWEGCHGCDENDKQFWINGFITGILQVVDLDVEQPKISKNNEIEI
jgi:hypothetical protein